MESAPYQLRAYQKLGVNTKQINSVGRKGKYLPLAIPFQPEVSEGELWYKAIDLIMTAHGRGLSKVEAVGVVKSQFTISKRDQL